MTASPRPTPPEGYETWLDWFLRNQPESVVNNLHEQGTCWAVAHPAAREELAALRARVADLEALLRRLSLVGGALMVRHGPPTKQPEAVEAWWNDLRSLHGLGPRKKL